MNLAALGNHVWQSTLVLIIAWVLVQTMRNNSARVRYAIWSVASLKFLIPLSLLIALGSHISIPRPAQSSAPAVAHAPVIQLVGQPFDTAFVVAQQPTPVSSLTPASLPRPSMAPQVLVGIWLLGVVVVAVFWCVRWQRVRKVLRSARRLDGGPVIESLERARKAEGISRTIRCLTTQSVIEPGVYGIFRPILLLPSKVAERLSPNQLEAIIEHEMWHVRSHDNLQAALHMVVETIFWFHPLTWWMGAQLLEERERACDERVLEMGRDPKIYAGAILKVCEFYVGSPVACLAGVTGSGLKNRIVDIMNNKLGVRLTLAQKALIAGAASIVVAAPILIGSSQSQVKPATTSADVFDVADVHPSGSTNLLSVRGGVLRGNRYEIHSATMIDLIKVAYGIEEDDQVVGGPSWVTIDRFDVIAKAPAGTSSDSARKMLQNVLADRFKLTVHNDTKPLSAYVLTVGKNLKLKPSGGPGQQGCDITPEKPAPSGMGSGIIAQQFATCRDITMARFVRELKGMGAYNFVQPVVDETKLQGAWDFDFKFTMRAQLAEAGGDGISLYNALDKQVGLKLEPKKVPLSVIVLDHVNQRPTDNLPGVASAIPPAPQEFEAAVIKPTDPSLKEQRKESILPGGRIDLRAEPLRDLISFAWDIHPDLIAEAPKWLESSTFDLVAKAPTPPPASGTPAGAPIEVDALRAMLRTFIIDQFKMETHTETRPIEVYGLMVPSSGMTKLKKADPANRSECKHTSGVNPNPALSSSWTCTNTTMAQLAQVIRGWAPQYLDHPVVDLTGLTDAWDFTISWTPKALLLGMTGSEPVDGYSMQEAVEKELGVKVTPQKHPMQVMVIDHMNQKPSGQ